MTDYVYTEDDIPSVSDPVWRILTGAAAFGIGVFICGSVGSYMPSDPSWNAATDAEVQNLFSGPGAIFADLSRQMLGWSAWAAGLAMMIGGAMRTVLIGVPRVRRWMMGLAFVPLSAAFFAAWPVPESWPLSAGLGGVVGDALFYYASMPFRALLLPSPNTWAGAVLGMASAWAALSALGFRRRDAHLLHQAATKSGRHAARQATGIGGFLFGVISHFKPKPRDLEDEELDASRDMGRARVIKGDDEYVDADSYDVEYDDEDELYDAEDETALDDDIYDDEDDGIEPIQTRRLSVPVSKPKLPSQPRVTKSDRRRKSTRLPSIDLLQMPEERGDTVDEDALLEKAARLTDVLKEFGVRGRIKEVRPGPVITLF
ncbi:MAG: DNA translocase FtsK 4TM domain-containing protein, partial [Hyphomonas sp.]|nr:DNA translocase FtsK 4TM domain-containing protein [Hyphomonas sp.]